MFSQNVNKLFTSFFVIRNIQLFFDKFLSKACWDTWYFTQDKDCCGYGTGGSRAVPTGGGDCLMIPGAIKTDNTIIPVTQCGNGLGLITATDTGGKTVCSKFNI